jgi:hypothetical protein
VAVAESPAFRAREDLETFIRWLAVHGREINQRAGSPPAKTDSELDWEAQLGPPEGWRLPDTPDAAEWVLNIPRGNLTLYCRKEPLFTTFDLRSSEVRDFLAWFRDEVGSIKIDPSRSEILGVDESFLHDPD